MAQKGHVACSHRRTYFRGLRTHPSEVKTQMPQAVIVIFLLFFAVLAFAWFYLQRAKARDAAKPADTAAAEHSESAH